MKSLCTFLHNAMHDAFAVSEHLEVEEIRDDRSRLLPGLSLRKYESPDLIHKEHGLPLLVVARVLVRHLPDEFGVAENDVDDLQYRHHNNLDVRVLPDYVRVE